MEFNTKYYNREEKKEPIIEETKTPNTFGIKSTGSEDDDEILEDSDDEEDDKEKSKDKPPKAQRRKSKEVISRIVNDPDEEEEYSTMHKIYIKGTAFDMEDLNCIPFYKLKPVNKIFSMIGVSV